MKQPPVSAPRDPHGCIPCAHPFFRSPGCLIIILILSLLMIPCAVAQDLQDDAGSPANTSTSETGSTGSSFPDMNLTDTEQRAYSIMDEGVECSYAGDYACAIASFDAAHAILPNDTYILYNHAVALVYMKRYDEAAGKIDAAIDIDPEDAELWYARGAILKNAGDYAGSGQSFEQAEDLDPEIGVSFFDHYPWNFLLNFTLKNITYVVLAAGFALLGIYILYNERRS